MLRPRQTFEQQMQELEQKLLQFGFFVEAMLDKAVRALASQDLDLAKEVVAADDTADEMDLQIEETAVRLLALQQPVSRDLRTIGTAMKVIADVERIGDYSVDIARIAIDLAETEYFKPLVDIPEMAELVRQMLRMALEALVKRDLHRVTQVIELDDGVDRMWRALRRELEDIMQQQPAVVPQAVSLILVARYLERIADHTENIVERVAYIETGQLAALAPSHRPDYAPPQSPGGEPPAAPASPVPPAP